MKFSLFLALRYLKPKRTFVSVITLLSVIGVCLGVTVLMVVISVMSGFERRIKETVLAFEPHLILETDSGGELDERGFPLGNNWEEMAERVSAVEGVEKVLPFIQDLVFMEVSDEPSATQVRAVDGNNPAQVKELARLELIDGAFDLDGDKAVVGTGLLDQFARKGLGLGVGDTITVYSPRSVKDLVNAVRDIEESEDEDPESARAALDEIRSVILPVDLEVVGVFDSSEYHGERLIIPLDVAQDLLDLDGVVRSIAVITDDAYRANSYKLAVADIVTPEWWVSTWTDRHQQFFDTVRMERIMMYFVLFVIVLVAAFSIMVTMITVTVQKRQEIGVVGAIGAKVSQIAWVFLGQGMVVGLIGVAAGLGLGGFILWQRNWIRDAIARTTGFEIFDSEVYGLIEIPAQVLPLDLVRIGGGAFLLCTVAALLPAVFAAQIDPAKALRNVVS